MAVMAEATSSTPELNVHFISDGDVGDYFHGRQVFQTCCLFVRLHPKCEGMRRKKPTLAAAAAAAAIEWNVVRICSTR